MIVTELLKPDELVRAVAEKLRSMEKIYYFVRDEVKYVDEPVDKWRPASEVIRIMSGDCDDQAVLLASMLLAVGYDAWVRVATIKNMQGEVLDHAWVIVRQGMEWIELDPTCEKCRPGDRPFIILDPIMDFTTDIIRIHNPKKAEQYIIVK